MKEERANNEGITFIILLISSLPSIHHSYINLNFFGETSMDPIYDFTFFPDVFLRASRWYYYLYFFGYKSSRCVQMPIFFIYSGNYLYDCLHTHTVGWREWVTEKLFIWLSSYSYSGVERWCVFLPSLIGNKHDLMALKKRELQENILCRCSRCMENCTLCIFVASFTCVCKEHTIFV